jgi:glutathione S-transferase
MRLYCFGESGHSYKVAQAMDMMGIAWDPEHVDFFNGEARGPEFRKLNPMGECPVLVDGDLTLTQSGVILDYLVEKSGLLSADNATDRREIQRWILWDNHKMSGVVGMLRFLMNFLPEEKRPAEVIAFTAGRAKAAFKILDGHLQGRDFVATNALTTADLSCASYLYYPEPITFDRAEYPNIDRWLDRIAEQPGWKHPYDLMRRAFPPNA